MWNNLKDYLQTENYQNLWKKPPFIDHLFEKINEHKEKEWRVLILTLTKRSAEEVNNFFLSKWYKSYYLHSEIDSVDRWDIINKLKSWEIDILVGVNLLREWIDLPEVSFIAILDADKEGFLRSTTSLIQIIWRAARNPDSEVVLYGDQFTESMWKALYETYRRRQIQQEYNDQHWITPQKAISNVKDLNVVKTDENLKTDQLVKKWKVKKLKKMTKKEKQMIAQDLKSQLDDAIKNWDFEKAASLRDQLKEIEWD